MCCCQHERGLGVQILTSSIEQLRLVKRWLLNHILAIVKMNLRWMMVINILFVSLKPRYESGWAESLRL